MDKKFFSETDKLAFDLRAASKKSRRTVKLQSTSAFIANSTQGYGLRPLQQNELQSIYALFAWVANEQGTAPETVQAMTEVRFCVNDVVSLQQKDYDEVIKFLVDLRIDDLRN